MIQAEKHTENAYRNKITYLSFLLAFGVVLRHAMNIDVYGIESGILYWIGKTITELTDTIVPSFFAISGYLYFQNYTKDKLFSKWKSRIRSLLIPYLFWNLVGYLFFVILASIPYFAKYLNDGVDSLTAYNVIKAAVLGGYNITWFLQNLMVYILIFPLLFPFVLSKKDRALLLMIVTFLVFVLTRNKFVLYAVIFEAGAIVGIHYKDSVKKVYSAQTQILCALVFLFSVFVRHFIDNWDLAYIPLRIIQIGLIWVFTDRLATEKKPAWCFTISFFVYCTHTLILESVEKVFLIATGKTAVGAIIDFIFAPLITMLIIVFAAFILGKIKPLWRFISGGRG